MAEQIAVGLYVLGSGNVSGEGVEAKLNIRHASVTKYIRKPVDLLASMFPGRVLRAAVR